METAPRSAVELVKERSAQLRGTIGDALTQASDAFGESDATLLKFHGSYQQEDRDQRRARRETGEGKAYRFMVRTRVPGGVVSPEQYLAEDDLAERYGNGTVRVTTRQGFQLHGVIKGDLRATIAGINAAALTTLAACGDVNRNVMACPAPPQNDAEIAVQGFAGAIARRLAPRTGAYREIWIDGEQVPTEREPEAEVEPLYGAAYLPRKFKIGIARPADNCVDVYTQDIGLLPVIEREKLVGFTILVGGGMGMTHGKKQTYPRRGTPLGFARAEVVLDVVEAIVAVYRDWGDRSDRKHARFKYLVQERGIDWIRAQVEARADLRLEPPREVPLDGVDDHLGWHRQSNGRWCLGLFVENGRIKDSDELRLRTGLRETIRRFKPGIRLTGQQNVLLTDVEAHERGALEATLRDHGVVLEPEKLGAHRDAMACPALPTCGLALTDAERVLPNVVAEIDAELKHLGIGSRRLSIRMTGCPNGCARPYMGDIGFVGRSKDLYDIFLGGDWANTRLNWHYEASVKLADLSGRIAPLLRRWRDEGAQGETFGDFCTRALQPTETRAAVAVSS